MEFIGDWDRGADKTVILITDKFQLMRMNNPKQVVFFIAIKVLNTVAKLFKKHRKNTNYEAR